MNKQHYILLYLSETNFEACIAVLKTIFISHFLLYINQIFWYTPKQICVGIVGAMHMQPDVSCDQTWTGLIFVSIQEC